MKRKVKELQDQLDEIKRAAKQGENLKVRIWNSYGYYQEIPLEYVVKKILDYLGLEFKEESARIELIKKPLPKKKTSKKKKGDKKWTYQK